MADIDYVQLQQHHEGHYIARHDAEVIANAKTCDELSDYLDSALVS
jgi:hypothetical protein